MKSFPAVPYRQSTTDPLPANHVPETAMTSSELTSDVRAFLDNYNEAFASIDGHRIAATDAAETFPY